jgi:hypothetical protein
VIPAALVAIALAAVQAAPSSAPGGCPPGGAAQTPKLQAYNVKCNRTDPPGDSDIDSTATLDAMLETGPDQDRWSDSNGAELTGYVVSVQDGGLQSADCFGARELKIFLASNSVGMDPAHEVVVVVTPAWRRKMAARGVNWSLDALTAKYQGQFVRLKGWLLYNFQAAGRAMNTAEDAGPGITQATAWEIHPMTAIKLETNPFNE